MMEVMLTIIDSSPNALGNWEIPKRSTRTILHKVSIAARRRNTTIQFIYVKFNKLINYCVTNK